MPRRYDQTFTQRQVKFAHLYVEQYLPGLMTLKEIYKAAGYGGGCPDRVLKSEPLNRYIKKMQREWELKMEMKKTQVLERLTKALDVSESHYEETAEGKDGREKKIYNGTAVSNGITALSKISAMMGYDAPQKQEQKVVFDLGGVSKEELDEWMKP